MTPEKQSPLEVIMKSYVPKNGNQEDIENSRCTHLTKTESHTYTNPENIAQ